MKHWAIIGKKKYEVKFDKNKVLRFPRNRILDDLLEAARFGNKLDLNMISIRYQEGKYTREEMKGLYLNIGYSVSGISDLSFFSREKMDCCCWRGHKKKRK